MKLNEILDYIDVVIQDRFVKDKDIDKSNHLLELGSNDLTKSIVRLKRINRPNLNIYRTLLLVEANKLDRLKEILHWTAAVKNSLTNPETSDLYLIIVSEDNIYTCAESMCIEATEQFCKKYVQRESEKPAELIRRTNLAIISSLSSDVIQSDPVDNALRETEKSQTWFDSNMQKKWRQAFESEESGNELLDLLK
ncbi:MAG: hypothetical protein HQM10_26715 [Candidatus Riflebacteria bacterium]|nr:hypothetical protein [Candidatus Riflebacteria bacterium]